MEKDTKVKKAFLNYNENLKGDEKYKNLRNYLGGDIYCREERQFAVILYNIFLEAKKKETIDNPDVKSVVEYCLGVKGENWSIKEVFFETTLMRDYFYHAKKAKGFSKEDFNKELLEFCLRWMHVDKAEELLKILPEKLRITKKSAKLKGSSYHLGQDNARTIMKDEHEEFYSGYNAPGEFIDKIKGNEELQQGAKVKACLDIASMMMNATPDILVVYEKDEKNYAKAIECKYLSDEGTYEDVAGSEYKMQLFIQECIMSFCFGKCVGRSEKKEKWKKDEVIDEKKEWKKEWNIPDITKGKWVDNDNRYLWEEICERVYIGILTQDRESNGITNAGVKMVTFWSESEKKPNGDLKIVVENGNIDIKAEERGEA